MSRKRATPFGLAWRHDRTLSHSESVFYCRCAPVHASNDCRGVRGTYAGRQVGRQRHKRVAAQEGGPVRRWGKGRSAAISRDRPVCGPLRRSPEPKHVRRPMRGPGGVKRPAGGARRES